MYATPKSESRSIKHAGRAAHGSSGMLVVVTSSSANTVLKICNEIAVQAEGKGSEEDGKEEEGELTCVRC